MVDPNSMLYWYPKLCCVAPTPITAFVDVDRAEIAPILYGEKGNDSYLKDLESRLIAASEGFDFPIFLRTDMAAGKHEWERTCFVPKQEDLMTHAIAVAESNEMADIMGMNYSVYAIREFLNIKSVFKAFLGMPIGLEWRMFAKAGDILCAHPYWFEDAIRFYGKDLEKEAGGWQAALREMYGKTIPVQAGQVAMRATEWTDTYWSADVCQTADGKFYLTDMALGPMSYHYEGCPNIKVVQEDGRRWWKESPDAPPLVPSQREYYLGA